MIIEICATTLNSVINAQRAGADRIELCEEYLVGGVTPSLDFTLKRFIYGHQHLGSKSAVV